LLVSLKRSSAYAAIRSRVANPKPVDAWQVGTENYFVFELKPSEPEMSVTSFALFNMVWDADDPQLAVIVGTPSDSNDAEVSAILRPDRIQKVSLPQKK
jgi:hypothetical protein